MADLGLDADGEIIEIEDPPDQDLLIELRADLGERDDLADGALLGEGDQG
jgi:hypothetical protein